MKHYHDFKLNVPDDAEGLLFVASCPCCGDSYNGEPSVLIYLNLKRWVCQHCGWRGELNVGDSQSKPWLFTQPNNPVFTPMPLAKEPLSWFQKRGISEQTLQHFRIGVTNAWSRTHFQFAQAITIPFTRDNIIVNVKYRFGNRIPSDFAPAAEIIPFGLDDIDTEGTIICSDDIEKLIFFEMGHKNVMALPFPPIKQKNNKLGYHHQALAFLEHHEERLKPIKKFILALGRTEEALEMEEELGRRLGRERCWTVKWPGEFKSAQELFIKAKENFNDLLATAKPYPVKGVFEISDVQHQFDELYEKGLPPGPRTGWNSMDNFYRPALGQWTLVTGIPSHGKSNFLDALFVNLSNLHDWKFCIFSPENQPIARHFANLAEKFIGSPFNPKNQNEAKMSVQQKEKAERWLSNNFSVILPDADDGDWGIDGILELARSVILRKGIQGMVIDPWNEIDHSRDGKLSETEHISRTISKIRQFARAHSVHIWVVAHPTKMHKEDGVYPVPTPYDVAGCHDEKTEVLTFSGWKQHQDVLPSDRVACYDPETGEMSYQTPQQIHIYDFEGEMHAYYGRQLNLVVTPNHKMIVKPNWNILGQEKTSGAPIKWPQDSWSLHPSESLTTAGYFLPTSISKPFSREAMEQLPLNDLIDIVKLNQKNTNFSMPPSIFALGFLEREYFLSQIFSKNTITVASPKFADELQQLGIEAAKKIDLSETAEGYKLTYQQLEMRTFFAKNNRRNVPYKGKVYCLTVPTGAYITRREGVMGISGNSAHFLNKADFALSIYRFVGGTDQTITDVYIQKVRFKENGVVGRASLRYNPSVGTFVDDIDQAKRSAALTKRETQPTEYYILKGKAPMPEFHDDRSPKV